MIRPARTLLVERRALPRRRTRDEIRAIGVEAVAAALAPIAEDCRRARGRMRFPSDFQSTETGAR